MIYRNYYILLVVTILTKREENLGKRRKSLWFNRTHSLTMCCLDQDSLHTNDKSQAQTVRSIIIVFEKVWVS